MKNFQTIIMIIDDDQDDIDLFCEAVKAIDHAIECVSASSGEEAFNMLNREDALLPDYIFLDLNMPRLNGKQCLKRLKASSKLDHIPVIIYSTSKLDEDEKESKQLGAVLFLTKPDKVSELRKAILSIIKGKFDVVDR
jgi:CheY-like chemotaxis protein